MTVSRSYVMCFVINTHMTVHCAYLDVIRLNYACYLHLHIFDLKARCFRRISLAMSASTCSVPSVISIDDDHQYPLDGLVIPLCYLHDLEAVLIPEGLIRDRIKRLAQLIDYRLGDRQLTVMCILKGSYRFFTALVDELTIARAKNLCSMAVEFVRIQSYIDTQSTGQIQLFGLTSLSDLHDQDVLIVDDIVDSGLTLTRLLDLVAEHRPRSVTTAVLLRKRRPEMPSFRADFVAFDIPDKFIIGYGLDYNQKFRDLNHICIMNADAVDKYGVQNDR